MTNSRMLLWQVPKHILEQYSVMITSDNRGKRETNVGDGGEKSALGMEESQEGKNSNSGGKSINTGNYS